MIISSLAWLAIFVIGIGFVGCIAGVIWLFRNGSRKYGKGVTSLLMGGLGGLMLALPLWAVGLLYPDAWRPRHLLGPLCIAVPMSLFMAAVTYVHFLTWESARDLFWKRMNRNTEDRSESEQH